MTFICMEYIRVISNLSVICRLFHTVTKLSLLSPTNVKKRFTHWVLLGQQHLDLLRQQHWDLLGQLETALRVEFFKRNPPSS